MPNPNPKPDPTPKPDPPINPDVKSYAVRAKSDVAGLLRDEIDRHTKAIAIAQSQYDENIRAEHEFHADKKDDLKRIITKLEKNI